MLVAVDIDGVCADTLSLMLDVLNRHYGLDYTPEACTSYLFTDLYGPDAYQVLEPEFAHIFRSAPPVPGAVAVLNHLTSTGIKIVYLTSRSPETRDITASWLRLNNFPDGHLVCTAAKGEAAVSLGITLAVEDSPFQAADLARHAAVVLFDYPYNRHLTGPGIVRAKSWDDVLALILQQAARARQAV